MSNKKVFSLTISILVGITLLLGYFINKNAHKKQSQVQAEKKTDELSMDVSVKNSYNSEVLKKIVCKDAEVLFEIQPVENEAPILERSRLAKDENISGKNGKQLQEKYKSSGYLVKEITDKNVELVRKPIKYQPNRYVLLAENNEIIIAKSDEKGNVFNKNGEILNRQGTGTNINSLMQQDIENIINGDTSIQFDTIEKLNDGIRDFDIKYEMPE